MALRLLATAGGTRQGHGFFYNTVVARHAMLGRILAKFLATQVIMQLLLMRVGMVILVGQSMAIMVPTLWWMICIV
tara:strand:+ start:45666 stop:45893 length:228 start_codon:yes stop_codon:yes gene_type:complete